VNFLLRLALQGKKELDDSSRLAVVEIARVRHMLPSLFPSWSGEGLISIPVSGLSDGPVGYTQSQKKNELEIT